MYVGLTLLIIDNSNFCNNCVVDLMLTKTLICGLT